MSKKRKKKKEWFMNEAALIQYPRVEGETADRIVSSYYHENVTPHPVDFASIPELLTLAQHEHLEPVREHLENAANEKLPENVRIQHFDIAGAKMWLYCSTVRDPLSLHDAFTSFMTLWIQSGGV